MASVDLPAYRERWAELVRLDAPVSASSLTGSVMGATAGLMDDRGSSDAAGDV